MARKKKNGLSIAIIALNIVIVGIIILLIVLVYLHMKEDIGSERGGAVTTTAADVSEPVSDSPSAEGEASDLTAAEPSSETGAPENTDSAESTSDGLSPEELILPQFNRDFFAEDLFIGDSISTGLYMYDYLDADNVFAEVGLNPESALTKTINGVTCVEKAAAMQPKHIYIMLGTNGLAFMSADYMSTKMTELVAELEMACFTSKICVISIPPVTKEHDAEGGETMEKINEYNSKLKDMCELGGFTYVDICSVLTDSDGYFSSQYAEEDGLHFSGSAYALMLGTIESYLDNPNVIYYYG
ncbi:MAG: GDSL-type esterase/lipase family protein [Eubacterium sp.]|nr:GDSL-type esterase/lipase family protein [Eubacterium sp.]